MKIGNLFNKKAKPVNEVAARPVHSETFMQISQEYNGMLPQYIEVYNMFRRAYRAGNIEFVARTEYPSARHLLPTPVEYSFFSPALSKRIYIRETYPQKNFGEYMVHIEGHREAYFNKYNPAAMRAARLIAATEQQR